MSMSEFAEELRADRQGGKENVPFICGDCQRNARRPLSFIFMLIGLGIGVISSIVCRDFMETRTLQRATAITELRLTRAADNKRQNDAIAVLGYGPVALGDAQEISISINSDSSQGFGLYVPPGWKLMAGQGGQ